MILNKLTMRTALWALTGLAAAGAILSSGRASLAAQTQCKSNDAACFQAQAKAAEDAANRLLQGQPAAAPAPAAKAPPAKGVAAKAAAAKAAPAGAGGLASGEYDCGGGYTYRAMGKVDVQGGRYRYRPYGDVVSGFQAFSVAGGKIAWSGKFGGLDDPPAQIVESTIEPFGFNVKYKGNPNGLINTMSCHAPGK